MEADNGCITRIHNFDPLQHKARYRVGIYSSESDEVVYRMYNVTYAQYLTATAGQRFDPPIQFDIVPVSLDSLANKAATEEVDFFFSSSAVFSCMAAEYKAQPLTTIVNRREARGHSYDLDVYGGVIFTLATNEHVNNLVDLKDKTIGCGGITVSTLFSSGVAMVRRCSVEDLLNDFFCKDDGRRSDPAIRNVSSWSFVRRGPTANGFHQG